MISVRRNLIANLIGTAWLAILGLAFIPFYARAMGVEAYGLVGFFMSLQAVLVLADMGLGIALNRELARLPAHEQSSADTRALIQTFETLYWLAGAIIAIAIAVFSPLIAGHWFPRQTIPPDVVRQSLVLMGIAIALRFPFAFYTGALIGLQRHVLYNTLLVTFATLRWAGAAVALLMVDATPLVFFGWSAMIAAAESVVMAIVLQRIAGLSWFSRRFEPVRIVRIKAFAGGLAVVTILGALLAQIDKLVLSRWGGLETLGHYSIASTIAAGLAMISAPFFVTAYPTFSRLVAEGDEGAVKRLYHRSSRLLAGFVAPAAVMLALFAWEVLFVWTGDRSIADRASSVLTMLAIGFALHAVMHIPYALQLGHGWVSLALTLNAVAVVVLVPFTIVAVLRIGAIGAAMSWVLINALYVIAGVLIMHRRILPGEQWRWYAIDLGIPVVASLAVAVPARLYVPLSSTREGLAVQCAVIGIGVIAAAVLAGFNRGAASDAGP